MVVELIYVPDERYNCYFLTNKDTIRAYETVPYNPGYNQQIEIKYRDYYINSHYLYTDGVQNFGNYSTIPICLDTEKLTTNIYYRNDFDSIMIILFIFLFIIYFILKKIVRVFFHGFRWC